MDFRPSEARATLAAVLKPMFFPNQTWGEACMKLASLMNKLVHEARKCWPDLPEHKAIGEMLASFGRDDMLEAIAVEDTRPQPKSTKRLLELPPHMAVLKEITHTAEEAKDGHSTEAVQPDVPKAQEGLYGGHGAALPG